jgi:hypothetical protein
MIDEEFERYLETQRVYDQTKEFAEINEVLIDKKISIITCNIQYKEKRFYVNIVVIVGNSVIIANVAEYRLFIKEVKNFYLNLDSKYVELKTRKTEKGVQQNLNIKGTDVYLKKAEADVIVSVAESIDRAYKFATKEDMERCENLEYIKKVLKKSNLIIK